MSRTALGLSFVSVACLALLAGAGAAAAQDDATKRRCDVYGRIAAAQNEANIAENCGFTGPRWDSVRSHHYQWCTGGVERSFLDFETSERNNQLSECAP